MKNNVFICMSCSLVAFAGTAHAANEPSLATLQPTAAQVHQAAHIYYNAVSDERVVTLLQDQTAGVDSGVGSDLIWATRAQALCPGNPGYATSFFFGIDDPGFTSMGAPDPLSTNITILDYGDLPTDTVVDCIEVNWITAHPDSDSDSDSIGDGVEELAGQWLVWDAHNGRPECTALPLVDLLFFNLPGNLFSDGLAGYTLDVDLVGFGSATDLSFEICDTDGDCQTAAFCNSMVDYNSNGIPDGPIGGGDRDFDGNLDSDLDGDGLSDFAWSVRFFQPGIGNDFDSDSDTGVAAPSDSDTIGVSFGAPIGNAVDNGDGTWTWEIDPDATPPGTGQEDRLVLYNPPNASGDITYSGGFWFGGFSCPNEFDSESRPLAMLQFGLYGPVEIVCCPPDLNCDGEINFFDVSLFIQDFQDGGDYNGDGSTSFFDVSQFIQDYNAGCP